MEFSCIVKDGSTFSFTIWRHIMSKKEHLIEEDSFETDQNSHLNSDEFTGDLGFPENTDEDDNEDFTDQLIDEELDGCAHKRPVLYEE